MRYRTEASIGELVRAARENKGISQDVLSRRAGIPYNTYVKIENGRIKRPCVQNIVKIAQALELSVDQLLEKWDIESRE